MCWKMHSEVSDSQLCASIQSASHCHTYKIYTQKLHWNRTKRERRKKNIYIYRIDVQNIYWIKYRTNESVRRFNCNSSSSSNSSFFNSNTEAFQMVEMLNTYFQLTVKVWERERDRARKPAYEMHKCVENLLIKRRRRRRKLNVTCQMHRTTFMHQIKNKNSQVQLSMWLLCQHKYSIACALHYYAHHIHFIYTQIMNKFFLFQSTWEM